MICSALHLILSILLLQDVLGVKTCEERSSLVVVSGYDMQKGGGREVVEEKEEKSKNDETYPYC